MEKEIYTSAADTMHREIDNALKVLKEGGIILYPTDTVWGIGCDATDAKAVARIYQLKQRQDSKSMLCLLDSTDALYRWLDNVPETALNLIEVAVNPLTIIYDSPKGVAQNLRAPDGSLGIRVSSEPFTRQLCRRLRRPLVSTSANISGHPTAAYFRQIDEEIINGVDYVVDYRQDDNTPHKPSGIIKVADDETITIIR